MSHRYAQSFLDKLSDAKLNEKIIAYFASADDYLSRLLLLIHNKSEGFLSNSQYAELARGNEMDLFRGFLDGFLRLSEACPDIRYQWKTKDVPWNMLSKLRITLTHERASLRYSTVHRKLASNLWNLINRTSTIAQHLIAQKFFDPSIQHAANYPEMTSMEDIFHVEVQFTGGEIPFEIVGLDQSDTDDTKPSL